MCWNGNESFECLHAGQCGANGTCVCASACHTGVFCEIDFNAAKLPFVGAIMIDSLTTRNAYIALFSVLAFCGIVNNLCALATFMRERIRSTIWGAYLITFSVLSMVLMLIILSYILTVVRYASDAYRTWGCRVIPFFSVVMVDGSILNTAAIAVERALVECLDFSINGSRLRGACVSLLIILYVCVSNLDEIFLRRLTADPFGREVCTYHFDDYPMWRRFDIAFSYAHVIVPFAVHFICSICVLTTIARRKVFIRSTDKHIARVWLQQLILNKDFFIPPLCLIICILPHGILGHLLRVCIPYSDQVKLRMHIAFVLMLYLPQTITFALYVCPNKIYLKEFQETRLYRSLCFCIHRQQRRRQRDKRRRMTVRRRVGSEETLSHAANDFMYCETQC